MDGRQLAGSCVQGGRKGTWTPPYELGLMLKYGAFNEPYRKAGEFRKTLAELLDARRRFPSHTQRRLNNDCDA